MKEAVGPTSTELTKVPANSRLEKGVIYSMSNQPVTSETPKFSPRVQEIVNRHQEQKRAYQEAQERLPIEERDMETGFGPMTGEKFLIRLKEISDPGLNALMKGTWLKMRAQPVDQWSNDDIENTVRRFREEQQRIDTQNIHSPDLGVREKYATPIQQHVFMLESELEKRIDNGTYSEEDLATFRQKLDSEHPLPNLSLGAANPGPGEQDVSEGKTREERRRISREQYWPSLRADDKAMLSENPVRWLNEQFDTLYLSSGKDPATSQLLQDLNHAYGDATKFVKLLSGDKERLIPQYLDALREIFDTRKNLMIMTHAIGTKSMESISGSAQQLGAHGLFNGMGLDDRRVGSMFYRLAELLEDSRLDKAENKGGKRQHITPALVNKIKEDVITESVTLAEKKLGPGALLWDQPQYIEDETTGKAVLKPETPADKKARVTSSLRRTVYAAYDVLKATQREALIGARGRNLTGVDAFFSDIGSAFSFLNPEALATTKWGLLTHEDYQFVEELQMGMVEDWLEDNKTHNESTTINAEEKKDLGKRLWRDSLAAPDFFSSGWRMKAIRTQLEGVMGYKLRNEEGQRGLTAKEREAFDSYIDPKKKPDEAIADAAKAYGKEYAKNFALFMQLKAASGEAREAVWDKIFQFRPEEIMRLIHERAKDEDREKMNETVFAENCLGKGIDATGEKANRIKDYDSFKNEYGALIRAIREKYLDPNFPPLIPLSEDEKKNATHPDLPRQINFGDLDSLPTGMADEIRSFLDKSKGAGTAAIIENTFKAMQKYNDKDKKFIGQLMYGHRYTDIYTRTLVVDDAMLDALESVPRDSGMTPISIIWSGGESANDALKRNMNDFSANAKAVEAQIGFVKAEGEEGKIKQAEAAAEAVSAYNGRSGQAKTMEQLAIHYLTMAMVPDYLDGLGLTKLPFRAAITKAEKIFGPQTKIFSQDERRGMLDKLRGLLQAAVQNDIEAIEENDSLSREQKNHDIAHLRHKSEEMYKRAEKQMLLTAGDYFRRKVYGTMFMILFGTIAELVLLSGVAETMKGK